MNTVKMNKEAEQPLFRKEIYLGVIAIVVTIALCVAAIYYKDDLMSLVHMTSYGLLGLFIVSFVASSAFSVTAVPLPFWLLVLALPSVLTSRWGVLAPVWIGITTALGISLGQLLTFMIGYGSRSLSERVTSKFNNRFYTGAMAWAQRHGSIAVFVMSAVFNPLHLPMTIAIGSLHYPPMKYFIFAFLGNSVKNLFLAFCGYFGLTSLFSFLGA